MNKQQTAVEWLLYHFDEIYHIKDKFLPSDWEFLEETAKAMEQEQAKRIALHFIMLGGQECGCNWNKMNFTDEFNKLINNKRSV